MAEFFSKGIEIFCNFVEKNFQIMLLSMTGFGRGVAEIPGKKITVEVKSLNSKQLDIITRIPSSLRELDLNIRRQVSEALQRGKVELAVSIDDVAGQTSVHINIPALRAYKQQLEQLRDALQLPEPSDWYATLLRFPDALANDDNGGVDAQTAQGIEHAVEQALAALVKFRATEGGKLETFFAERIERIRALLAEVEPYEKERVSKIRARITDGLEALNQVDIDMGRLEQEMIFYIEKLDVTEEKQRLTSHLNYFIETLEGVPGQGKKLGFIAQEMGREINTLGSKSNNAQMQCIVVKMKDELEQIKEQVLNVL